MTTQQTPISAIRQRGPRVFVPWDLDTQARQDEHRDRLLEKYNHQYRPHRKVTPDIQHHIPWLRAQPGYKSAINVLIIEDGSANMFGEIAEQDGKLAYRMDPKYVSIILGHGRRALAKLPKDTPLDFKPYIQLPRFDLVIMGCSCLTHSGDILTKGNRFVPAFRNWLKRFKKIDRHTCVIALVCPKQFIRVIQGSRAVLTANYALVTDKTVRTFKHWPEVRQGLVVPPSPGMDQMVPNASDANEIIKHLHSC